MDDSKHIESISDAMNLDRTGGLFDAAIQKGKALDTTGTYTPEDIKSQRIVIGFGNLHLNMARVKMSALRLVGYRKSQSDLKEAIERKLRDSRKYPA